MAENTAEKADAKKNAFPHVQLHGPGSMKDVNVSVTIMHNARHTRKNGSEVVFANVALDPREAQANDPEKRSMNFTATPSRDKEGNRMKKADGTQMYNNTTDYDVSQEQAIIEAAGPDGAVPKLDRNGNEIGTTYFVKGDVMPAAKNSGYVLKIQTKDPEKGSGLSKSDHGPVPNITAMEIVVNSKNKAAREAAKPEPTKQAAAEKAAPAKAAEKKVEEPEIGF